MFGFEKLDVWQFAMEPADEIYQLTRRFPAEERFGLVSQLRRSAVSIAANVAEGSTRQSRKDFCRFIEISFGSLSELITQLLIAKKQGFVTPADSDRVYATASKLAQMLSALRNSLNRDSVDR